MEVDDEDNSCPAWNPMVFAADNGQAVPHHLAKAQDHLDLELSRSSMRFLRGDGLDISLDNNAGDDSSSSSDATSELLEECARFAVHTQPMC